MKDIYSMKESVYIEDKKNELERTASTKKPMVAVLIASVILIVLLNLINTIIFF